MNISFKPEGASSSATLCYETDRVRISVGRWSRYSSELGRHEEGRMVNIDLKELDLDVCGTEDLHQAITCHLHAVKERRGWVDFKGWTKQQPTAEDDQVFIAMTLDRAFAYFSGNPDQFLIYLKEIREEGRLAGDAQRLRKIKTALDLYDDY